MKRTFTILPLVILVSLVMGTLGFGQTITTTVFPLYVDGTAGEEGTPFSVHVTITGWTVMADSTANIKVAPTSGTKYKIWNGSAWKSSHYYSNCPEVTIDSNGDWSGWVYLKSNGGSEPFKAYARRVGATSPRIEEDSSHSITLLDMSSTGAWIYATAAEVTAGKAILVFDSADSIIGTYAIEDNGVEEGYPSTAGYFRIAVPANRTISKLQARNSDNSIFDTQTSNQWSSGDPGTETNLDDQHDVSLPVQLTSFMAIPGDGEITLKWVTESEVGVLGYEILKSLKEENDYHKLPTFIKAVGYSSSRREYSYTDREVTNGITYFYKLVSVDLDGRRKIYGPVSAVPQSEESIYPKDFSLQQNFPNPFNASTKITFDLPLVAGKGDRAYPTTLKIVDLKGKEVLVLINRLLGPGRYTVLWNGRDRDGMEVTSGLYFCVLNAGDFLAVRKVMVLR